MKPERALNAESALQLGDDQIPVHDVGDLLAGSDKAVLLLKGQAYTLRVTRQGKLLLTK